MHLRPTAALAAALLVACGGRGTPAPDADPSEGSATPGAVAAEGAEASGHDDHAMAAGHAGPAAAADGSLYVLDRPWVDQHGDTLALADLAGRPRAVVMAYTHCTFACPALVARMKRIETAFAGRPDTPGFVLVSIDPERDTPGRLAEFADGLALEPARWTLLSGSDDAVLELSVLLGVKYRATGDGDFAHANRITVLDREGRIVHRLDGLRGGVDSAVEALERALQP